MQQFLTVKTFT